MSMPPRQLPIPTKRPTTQKEWHTFRTRLTDYAAQVAQGFQAQTLRQVRLEGLPGTTGTVPFRIAVYSDNEPQAQLVADGMTLDFVPGVPGAGEWTMTVGDSSTTITLGTAAAKAWLSWLIAR